MKDFNYEQLANNLLDFTIEAHGLVEACGLLVGLGYTDDDLYFLGFEAETIEGAKAE
jgi:hypothetical protein